MEQMIAQCTQMMGMMGGNGMMGGMMNGGMMAWGTLLVLALIVAGVVLLSRLFTPRRGGAGTALNILQERYARGEIDVEEYQERRSVLLTSQT